MLRKIATAILPRGARTRLRAMHRSWVFDRAMRRIAELSRSEPGEPGRISSSLLKKLVYGWNNDLWVAQTEYLSAVLRSAATSSGPILECGSGLTTLLMGVVLQRQGRKVWSLEHAPAWAARMAAMLRRYGVTSVELCHADLRSYGDYSWYQPPLQRMPANFGLVVCDGPPGDTPGGRYGVLPVMQNHLIPGCTILLDDAQRPREQTVLERWATEFGAAHRMESGMKPYAFVTLPWATASAPAAGALTGSSTR